MIIRIERYFKNFDLKKQTPKSSMQWGDYVFSDDAEECDYLVVLDHPKDDFSVKVNKDNIIHLCIEPPNEVSKYRHYANKNVSLIFNTVDIKKNNFLTHCALPWHVGKSYDFLSSVTVEDLTKEDKIVWVTSNQRTSKVHNVRMDFLDKVNALQLPFVELYGRGINPINDKWDVMSPAKYAIAFENYKNDFYWTEKIMDCYLSYSMPIYFGCNRIDNFFPKHSYIQLDPNDKHIDLFLKEIVASKKWENNLDGITKARELILNEYQLFPFLYNHIKALEASKGYYQPRQKELISFKGGNEYFDNTPFGVAVEKELAKIISRIRKKI